MDIVQIHEMTGRRVIVYAGDIMYSGILTEVTEENVELQWDNQWITVPVDNINSVELL